VSALFFMAMWNSYHLGGFYYFRGGSQAVSNAMAAVFTEHGGTLELGTTVTGILVENNAVKGVRTESGVCYLARHVVSNANAPDTLLKMVGRDKLPAAYVRSVEAMTVGLSALVIYLGVDHDYAEVFGSTHEVMVNDSYDVGQVFAAIEGCAPERTAMALANYSVVDPGVAPPGKNVITITSQLGYACNQDWQWGVSHRDYAAYKESLAAVYIQRAERLLPGLSRHIEVMEVGTPQTIRAFTLNPRGTIFGFDNTPEQSTQRRLAQETPVAGLYLAGAWTFPGGGQSAVMTSGLNAANLVIRREMGP
jgi:prolycopene isomerase